MSLRQIQKVLNKTSRAIGDINAVKKGTLHKRVKNRTIGRNPVKKLLKF
ncbi:hypothetical protein LS684_04295 [Cytobacillus spongiae]|nr:hypothetical protein [Cytobacillus spongiae]UII56691.1 hypothetical protein LS684_04295 [Cytobacillus spongiae]